MKRISHETGTFWAGAVTALAATRVVLLLFGAPSYAASWVVLGVCVVAFVVLVFVTEDSP